MNLTVKYFDRNTNQSVELVVPADVLEVGIPEQEGLPGLKVTVNTDAVLVKTEGGYNVAGHYFSDDYAEFMADKVADEDEEDSIEAEERRRQEVKFSPPEKSVEVGADGEPLCYPSGEQS